MNNNLDSELSYIIRLLEYDKAYIINTDNNDIFICARSEYYRRGNNNNPIEYKNISKYLIDKKDFVIWSYIHVNNDKDINMYEEFPWSKGKLSANLYVLCINN